MQTKSTRERLLASTMIGGALALAMGGAAFAQEAGPAEAQRTPATNAEGQDTEVGEVVVTGSRIPQPNLTSVSPVTVVGQQDVQLQGITRTEDLINRLPQAFASQGSGIANGATGTATVDLRGLGPSRTLVLIDGRRLLPGDPNTTTVAADLNFIPSALVDRVEVVTGGASAVYGSDAISGVVNFIMQRNFEGVRVDAQYSFYQHDNENSTISTIIRNRSATALIPGQFRVPEQDVTDGYGRDITFVIGVNSPDGRGNVTAYATWRNIDAVSQADRDYSACSLTNSNTAFGGFTCGGSGTTGPNGRFTAAQGTGGDFTLDPAAPGGRGFRAYSGARDQFNFAPLNYYQRPDERYTLGAFAHYEISPQADVYGQFMFMDDRTVAQIAQSGLFFGNVYQVNCDSPLLSASQVTALCGPTVDQLPDDSTNPATLGLQTDANPLRPGQQAAILIGRRNTEGGPRQNDLRHTAYRLVTGVRGDLGQGWRYDLYGLYGTTIYQQNYLGEFSVARAGRALDVVAGPGGTPVCRSVLDGSDPTCVPYDIFSAATGPSAASLAYLTIPGLIAGTTEETVVSGNIAGDLGQYGFRSPMANDGLGVAFGFEYRRESLELRPDASFQAGDLAGQGGATLPVQGAFDVYEIFAEARLPLIQDAPFARELTLEAGYRFSDYSSTESTTAYKIGGDWRPIDDLRFRASFNRSSRAPNVQELFAPQTVLLDGTTDPCAGDFNAGTTDIDPPSFSLAQCQRTGVTPAQYGNILPNSANQYNGLLGGNPNLTPETSDTRALGVVYTPSFLPGFTISVDYYNITVEDRIGQYGADAIIDRCGTTGEAFSCSLIRRAPGTGSLYLGNNGFIIDTQFNTGSLEVSGIDVEVNYRFNFSDFGFTNFLADYGGLRFNYVGSYLDEYLIETFPGDTPFDCAGLYGAVCTGTAVPTAAPLVEYKHQFRVTWLTPWNVQASLNWRHIGSVDVDSSAGLGGGGVFPRDRRLEAQDYFDLSAIWRARTGLSFRVGVNNVLDEEPPLVGAQNCPAGPCSGNTYPQTYDALGRYIFVGVSADF